MKQNFLNSANMMINSDSARWKLSWLPNKAILPSEHEGCMVQQLGVAVRSQLTRIQIPSASLNNCMT